MWWIKNVTIISDAANVINNGWIGIEGDNISYIGQVPPNDDERQQCIDGRGMMAIPGLVNSHNHVGMTLLRSYADDLALEEWLFKQIFPIEDRFDAETVYWASMLAIAEMIRGGTTAFADMYSFEEMTAKAVAETGIKANLARGLQGEGTDDPRRFSELRTLYRDYHGTANGRILVSAGPHAVYTCSTQYLHAVNELASELGIGIHVHLSETREEVANCRQQHGKTPVAYLADIGLLDKPTVAAHCVHITAEDIQILKEKGVFVASNPGSNLKLASGIAPLADYLAAGLQICLGTDGAASNNNLDMFEEMRLAALLSKGILYSPEAVSANEAFTMATLRGAQALGFKKSGVLAPGMKADLVLLNMEQPHLTPRHNPVSLLVYAAAAADVDTVIVDGQILMEKRELKTLDLDKVLFEAERCIKRIF